MQADNKALPEGVTVDLLKIIYMQVCVCGGVWGGGGGVVP